MNFVFSVLMALIRSNVNLASFFCVCSLLYIRQSTMTLAYSLPTGIICQEFRTLERSFFFKLPPIRSFVDLLNCTFSTHYCQCVFVVREKRQNEANICTKVLFVHIRVVSGWIEWKLDDALLMMMICLPHTQILHHNRFRIG
jgi:hypothetical protein